MKVGYVGKDNNTVYNMVYKFGSSLENKKMYYIIYYVKVSFSIGKVSFSIGMFIPSVLRI